MIKYTASPNPEKSVKVYGRSLRISRKNSVILCKAINNISLIKGKRLLEDVLKKKRSIDGKYYTNTTEKVLSLLASAENNAEFKGLDTNRLVIRASAHKGFTFWRPRRFQVRRRKGKVCNVQIILEQR